MRMHELLFSLLHLLTTRPKRKNSVSRNPRRALLLTLVNSLPFLALSQGPGSGTNVLSLDSLLNVRFSTASKVRQTISEAPASVTIITSEDIERYGYRTLDELLSTVKGFYRSYDRNYAYVGSRGFSRPTDYNDRILLMIDGHQINDNFYGSASVGTDLPIDLTSVERIDIVRGPGSALYGTGAMFAVLNIVTKRGMLVDGVHASAEAGSFGRRTWGVMAGKEFDNGLDVSFSGSWTHIDGQDLYFPEYDDPATNNGIANNLDKDMYYGMFGSAHYREFTVSGAVASREKGIPTGAFSTLFNDGRAKTLDEFKFLELKSDFAIGRDKELQARAYYHLYTYKGTYPYSVISYDATEGKTLGGELQFLMDLSSSNRLTAGAEAKGNPTANYHSWDLNATYFDANFPFNVYSLYLQDEYQIAENFLVTFGLRGDHYTSSGSSLTPRGAVIYYPFHSSTVKLLYGKGFRAPNVYEAEYQDSASGFKRNPSLTPEEIQTLEGIWEQRIGQNSFGSISIFRYGMKDLIDTWIDPADSMGQFRNLSSVRAYGFELDLVTRWESGWSGYANYTFEQAEDAETMNALTNSPNHLFHFGTAYPFFNMIQGAVEVQYESGRKTVYGSTTSSFLLTNVNILARQFGGRLCESIAVRNLFNVAYKTPGGIEHREPAILQDGRNYIVRVEYKF